MKAVAMIGAASAAMLASASPAAAQAVDQDMVCMVAMATASETIQGEPTARIPYDRAGGYFLAIVAKRYPTPALFAPQLQAATSALNTGDKRKIDGDCIRAADPALDLITQALDIIEKK